MPRPTRARTYTLHAATSGHKRDDDVRTTTPTTYGHRRPWDLSQGPGSRPRNPVVNTRSARRRGGGRGGGGGCCGAGFPSSLTGLAEITPRRRARAALEPLRRFHSELARLSAVDAASFFLFPFAKLGFY